MSDHKPIADLQDAESTASSLAGAKKSYKSPALTRFGSVRDLTGGNSMQAFDEGSAMTMNNASDRALKENVVRIGEHPAGFGIYLFDYKPEFRDSCGQGRQFGVMADEVEGIVPDAVSTGSNGYLQVNYGLIGVTRH